MPIVIIPLFRSESRDLAEKGYWVEEEGEEHFIKCIVKRSASYCTGNKGLRNITNGSHISLHKPCICRWGLTHTSALLFLPIPSKRRSILLRYRDPSFLFIFHSTPEIVRVSLTVLFPEFFYCSLFVLCLLFLSVLRSPLLL